MVSTNEEVLNQVNPVEVQLKQQQEESVAAAAGGPITEEEWERAQKLFQLGKKNLFLNKYDESVNNIGDACKAFASKYGEMDPKCAEVYFFYGRSLLELARVESTVLGNALTGVPEEEAEVNDSRYGNPDDVAAEEKNEISEKVIDALCNNGEQETAAVAAVAAVEGVVAPAAGAEPVAVEAVAVVAEGGETVVAATAAAAVEAEGEAEEEDDEEDDEEEETEEVAEAGAEGTADAAAVAAEDADDITNLQSAWEMFELAKLIFTKNFDNDLVYKNKRIAECLLKLGEISIEQETYEQAVTDIGECIRVQEELASGDRDERMLAESYYQLGLARQFNNQWAEANEAYQRSINIVQLRVEKLRGRLLGLGAEDTTEDVKLERTTINDEIAELELLLPEMTSKLEEVNEQGQQTLQLIREAKECFTSTVVANGGQVAAAVNGGDVKDITSLVKSKRKNESEEDGTTKKTRLSNEGAADEEVNGTTAAAAPIEVDENKENKVEDAAVWMEEVKETATSAVNGEVAVEEPVAVAVAAVVAEPVATA